MAKYEKKPFNGGSVVLDGNEYIDCRFDGCELIFSGGTIPTLMGNKITNCRWTFDGPAARTIQFMAALYQGGAREVIEATFDNIRGNRAAGVKLN